MVEVEADALLTDRSHGVDACMREVLKANNIEPVIPSRVKFHRIGEIRTTSLQSALSKRSCVPR